MARCIHGGEEGVPLPADGRGMDACGLFEQQRGAISPPGGIVALRQMLFGRTCIPPGESHKALGVKHTETHPPDCATIRIRMSSSLKTYRMIPARPRGLDIRPRQYV